MENSNSLHRFYPRVKALVSSRPCFDGGPVGACRWLPQSCGLHILGGAFGSDQLSEEAAFVNRRTLRPPLMHIGQLQRIDPH